MCGDRKIALARRLTELHDNYDRARGEGDRGDHSRDRGCNLPIYRWHPVGTVATERAKRNVRLQTPAMRKICRGMSTNRNPFWVVEADGGQNCVASSPETRRLTILHDVL